MTNITELKMNVDLFISDKKIWNIDITISNCKLFVVQVKKLDEVLYIDSFIDTLVQVCCNVTKNDILDYITNCYY